ncbi:MAG: YraN family protein [Kiritimatiellae bacterium]|jgi:putative endonuclease|nr:YraN family protein [Kiritimatiellia bacterium]MDD4342187.1 YraN family protein [Kiritimatiellia bacterium]MDY0149020.1 YraN family protein [Kiritimatiellia bacterium]
MNWPWPLTLLRKSAKRQPASQRTGAWGEALAARLLRRKGYRILGRNVRFGSRCELDLVARSPAPETLVFVEVKTRRSDTFGRPMVAVDRAKRRALGRAAHRYLRHLKVRPSHIRFDVVEVIGLPTGDPPVIRHIENAFSPGPGYRV